ncbi:MAG: GxxExxY protein [Candidatus Bipolaricaulota bacterium]|nr:GxxExxY protein [Candidatus Bipolaricaulota bacterium]
MEFDELSNRVIECAIEVHRELGPGLLESTYEQCLAHELKLNGIQFELQHPLLVKYKGVRLDCGYRVDILVEDKLIIELKSVEQIKGIHEAQLLTYMKLAGVKIGLLINFNVTKLKNGIKRFVL